MELFKLFGKFAIEGADKANSDITNVSTNAKKSSSIIGKLGSAIQNAFKPKPIENVDKSVEKLTYRMASQQNKVDLLKRKYADLYLTHGKNSKEAKECAAEIKELSSELEENRKSLEKAQAAADKYDKSIEGVAKNTEKSGSRIGKVLGSVGSVAATIGKTVAVGLAAAGVVIAGLSASSLSAYADYEQLVGGVETLFKDSAGVVQEYAANAYKTAGLSANEYMETVTSFSASLLQSLGGDTQKTAEMADLAITDMSDNANKMGTDMASIQNAYQGFAKQNYTMLDNLKLGYGGTQEEMQRLIDDANALNAAQGKLTEYSIDSYADIVSAIHDVQTEMGITGTTAKEASTTIRGSCSAAKSAWKNLLIGFADGNQDLDVLIDNFVSSVITAANNIVPRLGQILGGLSSALEKLMPVIAQQLPGLIKQLLPGVISGAVALFKGLVQALPTILKILTDQLPFIISQVGAALKECLPLLFQVAKDLFGQVWKYIFGDLLGTNLGDVGNQIFAIFEELLPALLKLLRPVLQLLVPLLNLLEPIFNLAAAIAEPLATLIELVAIGLSVVSDFVEVALVVQQNMLTFLTDILSGTFSAAVDLVMNSVNTLKGIFSGLIDFITGVFTGDWDKAWGGISQIFSSWWEGLKNTFSIPMNWIIDGINSFIRGINRIEIPEWVPGVGGLGFSIPELPELEQGGVLEKGQVGLLEGNGAEAVVPLHQNKKWISAVADDMDEAIGGSDTAIVSVLREILEQLKIIASAGNAEVISLLAQILDSMGDDLKAQIANTTVKIDNRVVGRVVRGLV